MRLVLYSTDNCHLCEEAYSSIIKVIAAGDVVERVDIAENDQLMELYGVKIPVLKKSDSDTLLCWPFDAQTVRTYIETSSP